VRGDPSEHVDIHELELGYYENWASEGMDTMSPSKRKEEAKKRAAAAGGQQHMIGMTGDASQHLAASQTKAFTTSGMGEGSSVETDSGWSSQRVQKEREKAARRAKLELLRREEKRRKDEKEARDRQAREGRTAMRRRSITEAQSKPSMWKMKTKGKMKVAGLLNKGVEHGDPTLIPIVWSAVKPPIPGGDTAEAHKEMLKFSHSTGDPNDQQAYPQHLRQLHGPPECSRHAMAYLTRLDCMFCFGGQLAGSLAQCVPTANSYGGIHLLSLSRRRWLPTTAPKHVTIRNGEDEDSKYNGHAGAAEAAAVVARYGHAMVAVGERVFCFFGHPNPALNHPMQTLDEVLVSRGLEDAYEERSRMKVEAICAERWDENVTETERLLQVHKVAYAERIWLEQLMMNDKDTAHVESYRMHQEDEASMVYEMTTLRPAHVPDPPCPTLCQHWSSATSIKFYWAPVAPVKRGTSTYCTDIVYLLRVSKKPAREYMSKLPYLKGLCVADTEKDFDLVYAGRDPGYVLTGIVPTVQLQPASGNQKRAFDAKRMSTLKQDKKAEIKMMLHEKKLAAAAAERRKKKNPMNAKKKKDDSDDEEEDDDGLDITMSDLPEGARLVSLSYLNQQKQQDRAGRWHSWESEMTGYPDTRVKNKWGMVEGRKRIWLVGAPGTTVVDVKPITHLKPPAPMEGEGGKKKNRGKQASLEEVQVAADDLKPKCQFGKGHEDDLNSGKVVVDAIYEDVLFQTSGAWQYTAPGPRWEGKRNKPKPGAVALKHR
jgi:hypothetical protein